MTIRPRRFGALLPRTFIVAMATIAIPSAVLTGCSKPPTYDPSAAAVPSDAEATTEVTRLFEGVMKKDLADLGKFLAPNFMLQRTIGGGLDRAAFIAALPDLDGYKLEPISGRRFGDTLTATYSASTDLHVEGRKFPATPSPFLSTCVRVDGEWHLVSHGNFAVPK